MGVPRIVVQSDKYRVIVVDGEYKFETVYEHDYLGAPTWVPMSATTQSSRITELVKYLAKLVDIGKS